MFAVHVRRLEPLHPLQTGWVHCLDRAFGWLLTAEPFVSAAFVFIVGYSLVLSRARATVAAEWLAHLSRRALGLYLLSVGLFFLEHGPEWPDLWASSGILAVIAASILAVGGLLCSPRPLAWLAGLLGTVVSTEMLLEHVDRTVSGLNGGPGGAVPLLAFAAMGAIVAHVPRNGRPIGLLILATLGLLWFSAAEPWVSTRSSLYQDFGGDLAVARLFRPASALRVTVRFWNHTAWGTAGLVAPILLALWGLGVMPAAWVAARPVRPLVLVGRHALVAYVGHLCVIGLGTLLGIVPPHAGSTLVYVVLLTAGAAGLGWVREVRRARGPNA
jgi:hypothetical protein